MRFMTASAVKYRTEITNPKKNPEIRKCFETGVSYSTTRGSSSCVCTAVVNV